MADYLAGPSGINPYYNVEQFGQNNPSISDLEDPLLTQEKNFSKMLDDLTLSSKDDQESSLLSGLLGSDKSAQSEGVFGNSDLDAIYMMQQNIIELKRLSALTGNSKLLGKEIVYTDKKTNRQKTGIVDKLVVSQNTLPVLVLKEGEVVAVGDVLGLRDLIK